MTNKRAFTLIEILIAMMVITLMMSGIFISFISSMVLTEFNNEFYIAMNIAQAKMAEMINQRSNFDNVISNNSPGVILSASNDGLDGICRTEVTAMSSPPINGDYKIIDIYVCWKSRRGRVIGSCQDSNGDGQLDQWNSNSTPVHMRAGITRKQ